MKIIYHITTQENWNKAQEIGEYTFCALNTEGFIHCSTVDQYVTVANNFFKGTQGLILLKINEDIVKPNVIYENLEGGSENFPHIYGPLNIDAVLKVFPLEPAEDGHFTKTTEQ